MLAMAPHQLDRIADGVGDRLEVGVANVAPPASSFSEVLPVG